MEDRLFYLLALSMIKGLGPVHARNLIAYCGSEKAVFETPRGKLMRVPGIGARNAELLLAANTLEAAEQELTHCQREGIRLLSYLDDAYPQKLKFLNHAPLLLFVKGPIDFNAQPGIAIVGTRKCTDEGRDFAAELASFFTQRGLNVVSGLAYGIDIAAHRASLAAGGLTTAVLGHGMNYLYPAAHRKKAWEIAETGALLTEFCSTTKPEATNFPARNRIISGLSDAVVVVEAAQRGGALITAQFAFEQGREVFAVPGRRTDPYAQGCNALIRDQVARLLTDPQEVLDELNIQWHPPSEPASPQAEQLEMNFDPSLSETEQRIMTFLNRGEALVDQITLHTGIPMHELNSLLLQLEFKGLLKQAPGKRFRRA